MYLRLGSLDAALTGGWRENSASAWSRLRRRQRRDCGRQSPIEL